MTWCASFVSVLGLLGHLADSAAIPPGLAGRVKGEVARAWGIDAERVVLAFGSVAPNAALTDSASFRLSGTGQRGWFVAIVETAGRRQLAIRVRAGRTDSVWVASRAIRRGQSVAPGDASRQVQLIWEPPGAGTTDPTGFEASRDLDSGTVLQSPNIKPPVIVAPGTAIDFAVVQGTVRLSIRAVAQTAARQGEVVYATDLQRGTRLQGIVTAAGQARLIERKNSQ